MESCEKRLNEKAGNCRKI